MTGTGRTPVRMALVALAVLGLLAAAVALPAPGGGQAGERTVELGDEDGDAGGDGGVSVRPPLEFIEFLFRLLGILDVEPTDGPAPPAYDVRVQPEPIPGRVVTVTVTREGAPVEGARVAFNGRPIGRTDDRGQVSGEVPYERELVVTVTPPHRPGSSAWGTGDSRGSVEDARVPVTAASIGDSLSLARATQVTETATPGNRTPANATESFTIRDPVTLRITGSPDPGATVDLAASIRGVPMRDARVSVDGRTVGRTDDEGRYALGIPDDGTEQLRVRVVRGDFAGTETIAVRLLDARIDPDAFVAIPGRPATVVATVAGEPTAGAAVELDDRRLGTTDADGRLRFALPADPRATVTVRAAGQSVTEGLRGQCGVTAGLLGVLLVAAGAVATVARRRGTFPDEPGRAASSAFDRVVQWALRVAVWIADRLQWLLRRAGAALRRAARFGLGLLAGLVGLLAGGVDGVRAWLRGLPSRVRAGARSAARWSWSAPGRLLAWLLARLRSRVGAQATGPVAGGAVGAAASGRSVADLDLAELWRAFAREVAPGEWPRRTPGEVARLAVDRGFPASAVDTVTAAFRDASYGGEAIPDERLGRVRRAAADLLDRSGRSGGDGVEEERQ